MVSLGKLCGTGALSRTEFDDDNGLNCFFTFSIRGRHLAIIKGEAKMICSGQRMAQRMETLYIVDNRIATDTLDPRI